jgi:hypothetical protein
MNATAAVVALCLSLVATASLRAQVLYTTPGAPYVQSFNHPEAATALRLDWADNITFNGWFAAYYDGVRNTATAPAQLMVTAGAGRNEVAFYLYRTDAAPTDGALGAQPTDERCPGVGAGGIFYGVALLNATNAPLTRATLSFRAEQYRLAVTPARQATLSASYRIGGDKLDGGEWTVIPGSIYTTPLAGEGEGQTARNLDGNAPAHVVAFTDLKIEALKLPPGERLWIRWFDVNNRLADHGVGIDDVTLTLTP